MRAAVWFRRFGAANDLSASVLNALADREVTSYLFEGSVPSGPGMLLFEEISDDLLNALREFSRLGEVKVLAVHIANAGLSNPQYWMLLHAGAADVVAWSATPNAADGAAARLRRWSEIGEIVASPLVRNNLVGESPAWKCLLWQIVEVARFTDASVLVLGESGTGKELVARLIHTLDPRPDKRNLVVLDCTTIVPELSGSEFFGHERGAFTGAVGPREGAFAMADRGTLFLDEVGELPLVLQAQLLRVSQERSYKPLGGNRWTQTAFRLVCATNRDLTQDLLHGRFRGDLYYRIATWVCKLPPLRDRPEDILALARHFLAQEKPNLDHLGFDEPVREYLLKRQYPGNVRELKQLISRMSARHVGNGPLSVGDLLEDERPTDGAVADWRGPEFERVIRRALYLGASLKEISQFASETAIRVAVGEEQGNLQRAARRLGVTDRALQLRRANHRLQPAS